MYVWRFAPFTRASVPQGAAPTEGGHRRGVETAALRGGAGACTTRPRMRALCSWLVLALLVLVLGGFAFAPGTVKQVIAEVWRALV